MTLPRALLVSLAAIAFVATAVPATADACEGHKKDKFAKADANGDGFLTPDEVSETFWARIKVADVDNDNKVSKSEFRQAKKDGKFGKKHKDHAKA